MKRRRAAKVRTVSAQVAQAANPSWTPFQRAVIPPEEIRHTQQAYGFTDAEIADMLTGEFWLNSVYQVQKRTITPQEGHGPNLIWLSIKRRDRRPIRDWRHFQRIKNELVGPECEGVELYPADSRLVDTSNQFHLYCVDDPTFRFPFGFQERLVMERPGGKAKQRPFAKE